VREVATNPSHARGERLGGRSRDKSLPREIRVGAVGPGFAWERLAGEDGTTAIDIYLEVEADRGCHDFAAGGRLKARSRDKPLPREGGTARGAKT